MRSPVIYRVLGRFLQVFSVLLLVPLSVSLYYGESTLILSSFVISSLISFLMGFSLNKLGNNQEPTVKEGLTSTVVGWIIACLISSIPFLIYLNPVDAFFEATAGLTTTGMTILTDPAELEHSLLFWRAFIQWVGGLGILTFFIAVLRESGGISRKLFSAEADKTDPGTVRPSLNKTIISLWKIYGFLTAVMAFTYYLLGASLFDAVTHSFTTISTGGFSTISGGISEIGGPYLELSAILFMLVGGTNFVLLYAFFKGDRMAFLNNSEFKLYIKIFLAVGLILFVDLLRSGNIGSSDLVIDSLFHAASVITSTGFSSIEFVSLSIAVQAILIGVMFVGGSLGSTSGGFKVFRLKVMLELLKTRIRAYSLPETAINEVKIDREIISDPTVRTIAVIFFVWVIVVFATTVVTILIEETTLMTALSGTVSAAGNMGPVFITEGSLTDYSPITKIMWSITMLAGRLEMLPVLAIFNRQLVKNS